MATISASKLQKLVDKEILDSLSPSGFVSDRSGGCFSDRGQVYFYVAGLTQRLHGKNQIRPFGQIGFADVNRIKAHFLRPGADPQKATGTFQAHFRDFVGDRDAFIGCETVDDVPGALALVRDFVTNSLLPCLQRYSDPVLVLKVYADFDESLRNRKGFSGAYDFNTALSGLVLAKLHDPSLYASLKLRYRGFFDPLPLETKERVLNLIAYLDQEPLPGL